MMKRSGWLVAFGWVCLGFAGGAMAQPAPTPEDQAMDTLRVGIPRGSDDGLVDAWLKQEISRLRAALGNQILIPVQTQEFRTRFDAQYNHAGNTAEFKKKFAERVGSVFANEFRKKGALEPVVGNALARQLLLMQDLETREAIYAGLEMPDQVVRYLCAQTLTKLQALFAGDAQLAAQMLQQLQAAGATATNGMVAWSFYEAASLPGREAETVPVILTIMDARLEVMRGGASEMNRGELPALAYLQKAEQATKLDANLKTQVVQRLAPLLRLHTRRFGTPGLGAAEKAANEETIVATEDLLKRITKPEKAPDVSREMQTDAENPTIAMEIELVQWIGGQDTAGILNKAPWNVPTGAP